MKTLDEIGIAHGTDKASQFSRTYAKPHNYLVHLERFVESMRYNPIKILEIGVGGGESIQTWLEYFEQAHVYGVDIVSNTNPWNNSIIPHPDTNRIYDRYTFSCGDQSNAVFWARFVEHYGKEWDLIIDDGSHLSKDIILTHSCMFHQLRGGGIYVIEDLGFDARARSWISREAACVLDGSDIDSIYFARELAILRKK